MPNIYWLLKATKHIIYINSQQPYEVEITIPILRRRKLNLVKVNQIIQRANKPQLLVLFSRSVLSNAVAPWTAAHQAPLSMGFSRQEHWSGLPCPPLGQAAALGPKPSPTVSVCTQIYTLLSFLSAVNCHEQDRGVGGIQSFILSQCRYVSCSSFRRAVAQLQTVRA